MTGLLLAVSIAAEIAASTMLKYTNHFTRLLPTLGVIFFYALCYFTFDFVLDKMNLGTAYAIWSGVGLVATNILGYFLFSQKLSPIGIVSIIMIITGCVMLNLWG